MKIVKTFLMMFVLMAAFSVSAFAQLNETIGVHVRDATTSAPVVGVRVFIQDTTSNSIPVGLYTDSNGNVSTSIRRNHDFLVYLDSNQCSYSFPSQFTGTADQYISLDFDATCP